MNNKPKFNCTPDMIRAAEDVFACMAWLQTVTPVVTAYEQKILDTHQFHIAKKWTEHPGRPMEDRIILDRDHVYLMEDSDFAIYEQERQIACKASGLKVEDPEQCPLLVADHLLIKANRIFGEVMFPVTKMHVDDVMCSKDGMENYKKLLDLCLRLVGPFCNSSKSIISRYQNAR